jgi:hypothetical protein
MAAPSYGIPVLLGIEMQQQCLSAYFVTSRMLFRICKSRRSAAYRYPQYRLELACRTLGGRYRSRSIRAGDVAG